MEPSEHYQQRPQTYVKHFFLEHYLERVAYNIGSFTGEFVYVDGFSGPWRAQDEQLADTSFMIAIKKLRSVREGLNARNRSLRVRCIFVERNLQNFEKLQQAASTIRDVEIETIHGEFASQVPGIVERIGTAFSLAFIDPTGWTGIPLDTIAPILRRRHGEFIINFMFDHINRFIEHPKPEIEHEFHDLFGTSGWKAAIRSGPNREDSIVNFYLQQVRRAAGGKYVTTTRILKPFAERAYFYLVYGTPHPKGLLEFRTVERKTVVVQERIRTGAQRERRIERSGQREFLFTNADDPSTLQYEEYSRRKLALASEELSKILTAGRVVEYDNLVSALAQIPLIAEDWIRAEIRKGVQNGVLMVEGLGAGERTPKLGKGHRIRMLSEHQA